MKTPRVRFAPSPTGYLHVGGVRTLLLNWLYAKKTGGQLILRIEDTDQERSTEENTRMLLRDIQDLGFDYSEGVMPDGSDQGPFAPYYQSKRVKIYTEYVQKLLDAGQAYYAFDTEEQILQKREAAVKFGRLPEYDGAKLSLAEAMARIQKGEKSVVRFRAPSRPAYIRDELRGEIEFKVGTVDDFVLTRSPRPGEEHLGTIGMPTYNFCCVVDDHLMGITHVIRGEDHLSNTVKQQLLYESFGWTPPVFVHISMVLGTDKQKLSKRNGDASVRDYIEKGYLTETLMNFLVLLGWWPKGEYKTKSGHPEIITIPEMIELFDFSGLQKAPAVFDPQKLTWMNGFYIRMMDSREVAKRAKPFILRVLGEDRASEFLKDESRYIAMIDAVKTEANVLTDFAEILPRVFSRNVTLSDEGRAVIQSLDAQKVIAEFESQFLGLSDDELTPERIAAIEKSVSEKCGVKGKALFMPFRVSVSGVTHGPELKKILPILGRKNVIDRMKSIRKQGGF
jgi:nondiscriminating glutamyl-tRNA synthetase